MIVAFTGKKTSGKTLATKALDFRMVNFKDALVAEIKKCMPDVLEYFSKTYGLSVDELFKIKPDGFRQLMQNFGTELRRNDDENYWVKKWEQSLGGDVVVDDCRFLNEAEAVKRNGGIIIKITRPGLETTDTHQSELEMDLIKSDFEITNDGTSEDLKNKVLTLINENSKNN